MPIHSFAPITVTGRPIRTFIEVNRGDLVAIRSSGTVNFGGAFLGIGAPVLGPDGDNWTTPPDYPAPDLAKNSLIVGIRSATYPFSTLWFQGGTNRSFSCPVSGFISLAANDGLPDDNTGGWNVSLTITTPERFGSSAIRLGIDRVEFVQSMQRTDNSIPLIAEKKTLIRVFVNSGRPDPASVPITGTIQVVRADGAVVNLRSLPEGIALPEGTHDRNNIGSSLNFILPSNPVGTARFTIHVNVPEHPTDAGFFTEERTTATFIAGPIITINPFLIGLAARGIGPPSPITAMAILTEALQRLPVSDTTRILPFTFHSFLFPFRGDEPSWRNLLHAVGNILSEPGVGRIGEPGERNFIQVAFIMRVPDTTMGGIALPQPWLPVASAVCQISGDPDLNAEICAHEIGHTLGLLHAQCSSHPSPPPLDSHLPSRTEEPGWYAARNIMVAAGSSEMMTYCQTRWPSVTAYEFILNGHS